MQRVRLLGELGELFGAEHNYQNLRHPGDAIKLLCINKPAFKEYLLKSEENGIGFKVIQSDVEMGYEEILLPFGEKDLVIAPVIVGSGGGGGFGKVLAGVGLVALAIIAAPLGGGFLGLGAGAFTSTTGTALVAGTATSFATTAFLGAASVAIGSIGAALVLNGVAEIISPQPKIPQLGGGFTTSGRFGSNNRTNGPVAVQAGLDGGQSYAYTGAANTVGVGATVPLAYGKVLIGSHLLRSRLEVKDESDPVSYQLKTPGPDTMLIGGEKITSDFDFKSGANIKIAPAEQNIYKTSYSGLNNAVTNAGKITNQLKPGETTVLAAVPRKDKKIHLENFNVVLRLKNGFLQYVASNTIQSEAYITYKIEVFGGEPGTKKQLRAVDTATIQGMLAINQKFAWMHKMELPKPANTSGNWYVRATLLEVDALKKINGIYTPRFEVVAIGYHLV